MSPPLGLSPPGGLKCAHKRGLLLRRPVAGFCSAIDTAAYGPHKTLYSRWKRWSEKGIFARMMAGLAAEHGEKTTVMIDATYLKAHRTATSMAAKKGGVVA